MNKHEKEGKIKEIVERTTRMTCGINIISPRYDRDYDEYEHGDITVIIAETNDNIELWQMENMLNHVKKALYMSQLIENIYCNFSSFNKVILRCYYKK